MDAADRVDLSAVEDSYNQDGDGRLEERLAHLTQPAVLIIDAAGYGGRGAGRRKWNLLGVFISAIATAARAAPTSWAAC